MIIAPLTTALLIAVASVDTRAIPPSAPTRANMLCSLAYGCEVNFPAGEKLRDVRVIGVDVVAQVVSPGDTNPDINGAVVEVLPTGEFVTAPNGAMQPVSARLVVLTSAREYNIIVNASETLSTNRLVFTGVTHRAVILPMAPAKSGDPVASGSPEAAALDPASLDFGWRTEGDPSLRCVTVFSTRGQIWCKMPPGTTDWPSAYYDDGKLEVPLTARSVAQQYLVIDSVRSPVLLEIGGGHPKSLRIIRDRE